MMLCSRTLLLFSSILFTHCFTEPNEAFHHVHSSHQHLQSSTPSNQPYRTAFHFQPPKNWMNDPNGPMLFKGIYHLFYQYNPYGAVWGNIVWGHSTSKDLINWTPHKYAIFPSQPSDINGCWSGSATILPGNRPAILYTGINSQNQQVQNLALPKNLSDPYLADWIKSPLNPIIVSDSISNINASSFRDPSTAWLGHDKKWRVIIGSKHHSRGMAILYRSKGVRDLEHWTRAAHPLHWVKNTGMWECPDFYPVLINSPNGVDTSSTDLSIKHVLKMSHEVSKHDHYIIGTYNSTTDHFVPNEILVEDNLGPRYDYGKFYASKSFFDSAKKRRILWGWINESSTGEDYKKKGWSGIQAIPRRIWLDKGKKQLIQWPVQEIKSLRIKQVDLRGLKLPGGSLVEIHGVTSAQADVEIWFDTKGLKTAEMVESSWTSPQVLCDSLKGGLGPFGLLVLASKGLEEYTAVFFRIFKIKNKHVLLMCSNQQRSSLNKDNDKATYGAFVDLNPTHQKVFLRTLIDHSIVESFGGGGKTSITARVYPTLAIDAGAHLFIFNNGSESVKISRLSAWSMKKAKINQIHSTLKN